jgi:hypothetical protein
MRHDQQERGKVRSPRGHWVCINDILVLATPSGLNEMDYEFKPASVKVQKRADRRPKNGVDLVSDEGDIGQT